MTKLKGIVQKRKNFIIFFVIAYIILFAVYSQITPFADDLYYNDVSRSMSLFEFIPHFYKTWSGRIFSNILAYGLGRFFILWKIFTPIVFLLLCWGITRIVSEKVTTKHLILTFLLMFLMGNKIIDYAFFWATGSLYYLYPITCAIILLIPFFDYAFRKKREFGKFPLYVVLSIIACMGTEQVSICTLAFMALVLLQGLLQEKKILIKHLILFILSLGSTLIMLLAGGSSLRFVEESHKFYPEFLDMNVLQKVFRGLPWLFDSIFSLNYLLYFILFLCAIYLYLQSRSITKCEIKKYTLNNITHSFLSVKNIKTIAVYVIFILIILSRFPNRIESMYNFGKLFPIAFWGFSYIVLILILYKRSLYYMWGLLAIVGANGMLMFSPTIYASEQRTSAVSSIIFIVMIASLIKDKKLNVYEWIALLVLSIFQALRMLLRLRVFM